MNDSLSSFISDLRQHPSLKIQQRFEMAEFFGFETRNKYSIEDEQGFQVAFAAEQGRGILGHIFRYFLGHWRTFEIIVFGRDKQPKLKLLHPFRWFFQRIEVSTIDGTKIGALQQRFAIFSKKFDLEDSNGMVFLKMRSPFWRFWTFPITRSGLEVARIEKNWTGLFAEAFTDKDRFRIKWGTEIQDEELLLVLASGIFIDLQYFERKAKN